MSFTEYALRNKALVYFFVVVLVLGGIYSFFTMSKLEDPEYVKSYARGEYMLSKEGEQIFYLPSSADKK